MAATTPIRILQFGTTGQLAGELVRAASARPRFALKALSRTEADFRYPEQVYAVARASEPIDMIVNAVAYTAVDKAESEPDIARYVNTESVGALARVCAARNIPLIHISTDYVFDGTKADPYTEEDPTRPLGVYGHTKLEGENAIRAVAHRHIIIRTSWVYSARGTNFVRTMLRLGSEREELRIVDDQRGAPTAAADLASAILTIADRLQDGRNSGNFGTFHYADKGEATWRGFAEAIFEDASHWAKIRAAVVPITTAEYPTAARRPLNSRLDCTRIEQVYGITRPAWRESLKRVLDDLKVGGAES